MARPKRTSTQTTKKFADRLSQLIEDKKREEGMNHKEIAAALEVGDGTLSEWCSDNKTASIDAIPKIAEYFNVSSDWLLGLSDDRRIKPSAVSELGLSETAVRQIEEWKANNHRYLTILSDFITSKTFSSFLENVQHYRLLTDTANGKNLSDFSSDLKVIGDYKKTMIDILKYVQQEGDFSPYLTSYFSLHQRLLPGDVANFYLLQAQEAMTEVIKNEMTEYVIKHKTAPGREALER